MANLASRSSCVKRLRSSWNGLGTSSTDKVCGSLSLLEGEAKKEERESWFWLFDFFFRGVDGWLAGLFVGAIPRVESTQHLRCAGVG